MRPWMVNLAVSIVMLPLTMVAIGLLAKQSSPSGQLGASMMRTSQERQAAVQERLPNCKRRFLKDSPNTAPEYAEAFCECALPIVVRSEEAFSGMYSTQDVQRQCPGRTISTLARRADLKTKFDKTFPKVCEQALQGYEDRHNKEKAEGFCGCLAKSAAGNAEEMAKFAFASASFDNSAAMKLYARECGADFPAPGDGWLVEQQAGTQPRAVLKTPSHPSIAMLILECSANRVLSLSLLTKLNRDAGFSFNGRDDDLTFGEMDTFTLHLNSRLRSEGKQAVEFYQFLVDQFEEEIASRKSIPDNFSIYLPSPKGKPSYLVRMGDIPRRIGAVVNACMPKANAALAVSPSADQPQSTLPDHWAYSGRIARYSFPNPNEGVEAGARPIDGVFLECKPTPIFHIFGSKIEEILEGIKLKTKSDSISTIFSVRPSSGSLSEIKAGCGYDEGSTVCYIQPSLSQLQTFAGSQELSFEHEGAVLVRLPFGNSKSIRQVLPYCQLKEPDKKLGAVRQPVVLAPAPTAQGTVAGAPSPGSTFTLTVPMNHRTYPAADGRKAGELPAGTAVTVVANANAEWSEISVNGRRGTYVKNSALQKNSNSVGSIGAAAPLNAVVPNEKRPTSTQAEVNSRAGSVKTDSTPNKSKEKIKLTELECKIDTDKKFKILKEKANTILTKENLNNADKKKFCHDINYFNNYQKMTLKNIQNCKTYNYTKNSIEHLEKSIKQITQSLAVAKC